MTLFLVILIGGFAIAAATALVRGMTAFFQDAQMIRRNAHHDQESFGVKQNRMMARRVLFQGIAILLVVLVGSLASQS